MYRLFSFAYVCIGMKEYVERLVYNRCLIIYR